MSVVPVYQGPRFGSCGHASLAKAVWTKDWRLIQKMSSIGPTAANELDAPIQEPGRKGAPSAGRCLADLAGLLEILRQLVREKRK